MTFNFFAAALFLIIPFGLLSLAGISEFTLKGWHDWQTCIIYPIAWIVTALCIGVLL